MPLNLPRPIITLLPHKEFPTKINLDFIPTTHSNCSKYVVLRPREEHTCEGVGKTTTVMGEEDSAAREDVATAYDVVGRDVFYARGVEHNPGHRPDLRRTCEDRQDEELH